MQMLVECHISDLLLPCFPLCPLLCGLLPTFQRSHCTKVLRNKIILVFAKFFGWEVGQLPGLFQQERVFVLLFIPTKLLVWNRIGRECQDGLGPLIRAEFPLEFWRRDSLNFCASAVGSSMEDSEATNSLLFAKTNDGANKNISCRDLEWCTCFEKLKFSAVRLEWMSLFKFSVGEGAVNYC